MKNYFVVFVLLLVPFRVYAEWKQITESDLAKYYVDMSRIKKNLTDNTGAKGTSAWMMTDYKKLQTVAGKTFQSSTVQSLYDCRNNRSKPQVFVFYSQAFAQGNVIFNYKSDPASESWIPVVPATAIETLQTFICKQ